MDQFSIHNLRFARLSFFVNRFGTLGRADRLFAGAPEGLMLKRTLFGSKMACDVSRDGPQRLIYLEGERTIAEADLVLSALKPNFVAVDVGANIGYYMLLINKGIGAGGRIIAVEPSPENLPELHRTIELNSREHKVTTIHAAVGDAPGQVYLKRGINSGVSEAADAGYQVRIDTLDNLIEGPVDFLKMDIEGYEGRAIKGAARILSTFRPVLFLEIHPATMKTLGDSVEQLITSLQGLYKSVKFYEIGAEPTLTRKVLRRYFNVGAISPIDDIDRHLEAAAQSPPEAPFWALCRN